MLPQLASLHQTESCTYELNLRCERNDMKRQIVGLALVLSVLSPLEVLAEVRLGPPAKPTAVDRGEQLFNDSRLSSDGWISCRSCHTRGHTNEGLSDTLGDGGFGAPKKVLSLLGSGQTGPWAWNGQVKSLADQVSKSVKLTMRGGEIRSRQASDIAAYLVSLPVAPSLARARGGSDRSAVTRGEVVFRRAGCVKCRTAAVHLATDVRRGISGRTGTTAVQPSVTERCQPAGPVVPRQPCGQSGRGDRAVRSRVGQTARCR